MILLPEGAPADATRLFGALSARGHVWTAAGTGAHSGGTHVCAEVAGAEARARMIERLAGAERVLVMSRIGAHRDARAASLLGLWEMEERARASGRPVLTLRVAPMIGAASPLWHQLARRPHLPRGGRQFLNPVCEDDVIETLDRALRGTAVWQDWYEVAGPEVWSLAELAALAAEWPPASAGEAAWEPPLEEIAEHRLSEAEPWLSAFGLTPRPIAQAARGWAARDSSRGAA